MRTKIEKKEACCKRSQECMVKSTGCFTPLSLRRGIVRNPSGRNSHLSGHAPPGELDPVQPMHRIRVAGIVDQRAAHGAPRFLNGSPGRLFENRRPCAVTASALL